LTSLYYEAKDVEEEQGVNVLYLALGFLKWFETEQSEVDRYAPLVLLPVELIREGARDRFKLKVRDEDLIANVSLRVWLGEQHSIQLPEFPENDDWMPSTYFGQVRAAVSQSARWEVLENEILLGFFSFNKFLLWRDLDPSNWPNGQMLLGHKVLRTLLAPAEVDPIPESPVIPNDARVDDVVKLSELQYVLDADSSQTAAIQTALAGRNMVIQGPPGTGKSQTISNAIAAAVASGKSVLFVAEKLAALQVVHDRLKSVGLGHVCLELHSRKASKQQVLAQLRQAIDAPTPPGVPGELGANLDRTAQELWAHSDSFHKVHQPSGYTPYEVIGAICRLKDKGVSLPDFRVIGADVATKQRLREVLEMCSALAARLEISGIPANHPWRGATCAVLSPLDQRRLEALAKGLSLALDELLTSVRPIWPLVRPSESALLSSVPFHSLDQIASALSIAASKPEESLSLLCNPRWSSELKTLDKLLEIAKRLAEMEAILEPVFLPQAWQMEWSAVRAEIATHGKSPFRILRASYREGIRQLKSGCKKAPTSYKGRLGALDALMQAVELRRSMASIRKLLGSDLGAVGGGLPQRWERLECLVIWLHGATQLEPSLSVRNTNLIGAREDLAKLSKTILEGIGRVSTQILQLADFVGYDRQTIASTDGRIAWTLDEVAERVRAWVSNVERLNEWPPTRDELNWLRSATDGQFADQCYSGAVKPSEISGRVELSSLETIWKAMVNQDPGLANCDGRVLSKKVETFRRLDKERIRAAASEVSKRHHGQKPTGTAGDMGVIRAELNKSRKLLPVRKLLEKAGHAVQELKPVFFMSPLSVAQYLAPGGLKFDLLLIDEASQVRPADALGAVARAGQMVVVGDPKQLPPTNFFNRLVADEDDSRPLDGVDYSDDLSAPLGSMESILSLCSATFRNNEMLAWHYRSQHPGLIAVSNRNFYDNKLLLPPSVVATRAADGLGVFFHKTPPGGYDRGRTSTNVLEADIVADAVCQFAAANPNKSLGVGTFSVAQRDAIRARVDARRRQNPGLEPFFSSNRPMPFFVKNLESIQGDERDAIFISIGYGRDSDGRLTQNFGPINSDGGERRLNVLISRARERCDVFSPITADDVDVASRKPGSVALREFLQYAEKGYFDVPEPSLRTFDSDFEESVATFLKSRGLEVHPQVGMAGFYIDLGVIDPKKPTRYLLGIECDGATYHSSRSARDRDRIRQEILESRGWKIHRVWSTDWFHRRGQEEARLLDAIGRAETEAPPPTSNPEPQGADTGPVAEVGQAPGIPSAMEGNSTGARGTTYEEASFRVSSSYAPHEAPIGEVSGAVFRIVSIEGPIHEDEVCRRLATVWGLDRAGSRIRDAGLAGLRKLLAEKRCRSSAGFWDVTNPARPVRVRNRSGTTSITLRKSEYLPPEEIVSLARQIVSESARISRDELVVEVARGFGFLRTGQDLQDAIDSVLTKHCRGMFEIGADGYFTLKDGF
jgi:very-short-patch-repair endonuclease